MYKKAKVKRSFKEFSKDFRENKIPKVILLYGKEQYLVRWAMDLLVNKYVNSATKAMDYIVFDNELTLPSEIIEASDTFSMFSEKRVVWVKNYKLLTTNTMKGVNEKDLEELISYISNSNDGTILVFSIDYIDDKSNLAKGLLDKCGHYEFDTLERGELVSFASKRFKKSNLDITPSAMRTMIDETGYFNKESDYTLYNFENDIYKIIAHSDGNVVTENDIKQVISGDNETFVFDFLNGVTGNQKDKAFRILYNKLKEDDDVQKLIGIIVSQFELLLSIKQMRDDGLDINAMQKIIGGSLYRIKKLIPYSNNFSLEKLKEILSNAYEISWNVFTGLLDKQLAMEMFIAKI